MTPKRLSLDQARLRPHLRERAQLEYDQAQVFVREYARAADGVDTVSPRWKTPTGGDLKRLRGLPAIGPGVAGAMRGTNPVAETIRRDERRRR